MNKISRLMMIAIGALAFGIPALVQAEGCSFRDVSVEIGPVRSQGDIGWCYANAAADLLSFHYRNELHGQPVSALYTALLFNDEFYDGTFFQKLTHVDVLEGGSTYLAVANVSSLT
jgi:hypothetical protein